MSDTVSVTALPSYTSAPTNDTLMLVSTSRPSPYLLSINSFGQIFASPTGQFYADHGANVQRYADRLLIGAAADNPAATNRDTTPRDWLSTVMGPTTVGAYPMHGAQGASLARYGSIGFLTASRTSDAKNSAGLLGYQPASIGSASWVINDDTTTPTTTTGWAFYGEAWRMANVSYQPTFVAELEAVNMGSLVVSESNPYQINVGGGTYCLQLGSGGGQASASDASGVACIVRNPNRFQKGVVFKADAIVGTDGSAGDTGFAPVLTMGRNQGFEWFAPDGSFAATYRSSVAVSSNRTNIEHNDGGIVISNSNGQQLFAVNTSNSATNSLYIQSGSGLASAGLYVAPGASGNPNLGLYPASGGEIQMQSPVSNAGGAMPTTAAGGFLHININGTDYRIPLLTPAQAGS